MTQGNPNICQICHSYGDGCCLSAPGMEDRMFPLTLGEIDRIALHTNLLPSDFTTENRAATSFLDMLASIHPVFAQIMPGGYRIQLKVSDGKCTFLGPDGCELQPEIRPIYCRMYPFWFSSDAQLMLMDGSTCMARKVSLTLNDTMARLGTSEDQLKRLFDQLLWFAYQHQKRFHRDSTLFDDGKS